MNLCSEFIEQLDKWHKLLDSGAINQQQYDELQQTILSDINNNYAGNTGIHAIKNQLL